MSLFVIVQLALINRRGRQKCPAAWNVFLFYLFLLTITLQAVRNCSFASEANHFFFPLPKKTKTNHKKKHKKHKTLPLTCMCHSLECTALVCSSSQLRARCSCPPRCQTARSALAVAPAAAQTISCWQSGRQPVKRWALDPLQLSAVSEWVSECRSQSSVKEAVNDGCGDGRLSVPPPLPEVCLYFQAEKLRFAVIGAKRKHHDHNGDY